jgi:ribonuclease HI
MLVVERKEEGQV